MEPKGDKPKGDSHQVLLSNSVRLRRRLLVENLVTVPLRHGSLAAQRPSPDPEPQATSQTLLHLLDERAIATGTPGTRGVRKAVDRLIG